MVMAMRLPARSLTERTPASHAALVTAMTIELVARPLGALRRHTFKPALGREIEEARGEGGDAEVGVARHHGERRLGRGGEVLEREIEARFLEPALLLGDEDRPRRGQPQQRDRRLGRVLRRAPRMKGSAANAAKRGAARQTLLKHRYLPIFLGREYGRIRGRTK